VLAGLPLAWEEVERKLFWKLETFFKVILNGFGDCIGWFLWFSGFVVLVH